MKCTGILPPLYVLITVVIMVAFHFLIPIIMISIEKNFIMGVEKELEKRFGQSYLEYKRKVRRWL